MRICLMSFRVYLCKSLHYIIPYRANTLRFSSTLLETRVVVKLPTTCLRRVALSTNRATSATFTFFTTCLLVPLTKKLNTLLFTLLIIFIMWIKGNALQSMEWMMLKIIKKLEYVCMRCIRVCALVFLTLFLCLLSPFLPSSLSSSLPPPLFLSQPVLLFACFLLSPCIFILFHPLTASYECCWY